MSQGIVVGNCDVPHSDSNSMNSLRGNANCDEIFTSHE